MKIVKILPVLLWVSVLGAQNRPQFVWQGDVDGSAMLYLRDNRLDVKGNGGAQADRQKFRFRDRLPESRQDARVEVLAGRGYVHIVEQPRLENHYTLAVAIEDRQPGRSPYSIALFWDVSGRYFEHARSSGHSEKIVWSGRVDGNVMVNCQAKECVATAAAGSPVADQHFKFSRALPNRDVDVSLVEAQGRGEIRLVEQPSERNKYTARVSVHDPEAGAGEYSFILVWNRSSSKQPEIRYSQRGLIWHGLVDGRVRVTVQGGAAISEVIAGKPVRGERAEFLQPLPARSDLNPTVKALQGRGGVRIVEVPSDKNNYRLAFEIDASEGGPDNYEIEVDW